MNDSQRRILEMLQQGKISQEEANQLLEALDEQEPPTFDQPLPGESQTEEGEHAGLSMNITSEEGEHVVISLPKEKEQQAEGKSVLVMTNTEDGKTTTITLGGSVPVPPTWTLQRIFPP